RDVAEFLLHLGRHADRDHEVASHRDEYVRGDVIHQPAVNEGLAVADNRNGEDRQVDALEDCVGRVAVFTDNRVAAYQVDGDGQARDRELFELPVVEVFAEHGIEVPAAVLVQEIELVASPQVPEEPRRLQIFGELGSAVVAVEAGGIDDAGHGAGAGPGDHVNDDTASLQHFEPPQVRHAARRPAAEGHPDAYAAEVVDQPVQSVDQRAATR